MAAGGCIVIDRNCLLFLNTWVHSLSIGSPCCLCVVCVVFFMFCLLSFFSAFPRFVYCPWMLVFDCPFHFSGHLQYKCSCRCTLVKLIFIAQHTFHFKHFPICSVCVSLVILCQFISLYVNKSVLNVTTSLFNSNLKIVNF